MADEEMKLGEIYTFTRGGNQIPKLIPNNSPELVVIPSNKKGTGFYRKMYCEAEPYLRDLIS